MTEYFLCFDSFCFLNNFDVSTIVFISQLLVSGVEVEAQGGLICPSSQSKYGELKIGINVLSH